MSKRMNITVSDELGKKIEKYRGRLNFSKIAESSIKKEINKLENLPKEVKDMEDVIERLSKSKASFENESRKLGFEEGMRNAKEDMDYAELKANAEAGRELLKEPIVSWGQTEDYVCLPEDVEYDYDEFMRGWYEGVIKVWETVKDKV